MRRACRCLIAVGAPLLALLLALTLPVASAQNDPLPSWNEGATRQSVLRFVRSVSDRASAQFVAPEGRVATFDNDGTLWVEQPMYTQGFFALERVKALAPQHPEWKDQQPFKAVLSGDPKQLAGLGEKEFFEIVMATHAGMTTDQFEQIAAAWISTAKHPRFQRLFTELAYQPMLELLAYFRANGFRTYICSGGGIDFMRPWTQKTYGIPPEQVIGSSIKTQYQFDNGQALLFRLPQVEFITDKQGKPEGIERYTGRRPLAAFGNSDGDQQMLEWTAAGKGARFMLVVHHTDAVREYAYDRNSAVGRLDTALTEAQQRGWTVVDMKRDWKRIFAWETS
jgi:phosphoserine phosphatase